MVGVLLQLRRHNRANCRRRATVRSWTP